MKVRFSWFGSIALMIVIAQAALGVFIARFGPTHPIPVHFNLEGVANGWGDRNEVGVIVGLMAGLSALALLAIPALSRRSVTGIKSNTKSLRTAQSIVLFATSMMCAFVAVIAFGQFARIIQHWGSVLMAFVCLLFAGVGAYLGRVGPNPLVGVRTPWTYASRLAWDKANRLAGRLFFWGGLAGVLAAPFAPEPGGFRVVIVGVLAIAAAAVFESWRVWRHDPDRTSAM
jgi:uncharacterized membrane protein